MTLGEVALAMLAGLWCCSEGFFLLFMPELGYVVYLKSERRYA